MTRRELAEVYEALVHWADVVLLATPIRWGPAGSLYYRMAERPNCVQNQITLKDRVLINKKIVDFIITGGQDNIQGWPGSCWVFSRSWVFICRNFRFSRTRAAGRRRTWNKTSPRCRRARNCAKACGRSSSGPGSLWLEPVVPS